MKINNKKAGLYIHVPFCSKKCNYCDFYSFAASDSLKKSYVDAVISHAKIISQNHPNTVFDTVFIGGGTPTALGSELLCKLIEGVKSYLTIEPYAEFTIETNPGLCDVSDFKLIASLGVNRVSIGLQSANPEELMLLGRIHSTDDYLRTLDTVRAAGIENVNTDIMFSLPSQTPELLSNTLEFVCRQAPSHISAYALKIEDGTPFAKMRDSFTLPDEDTDADMYLQICDTLASNGYEHYEISNFAKNGFECKHNLKYWNVEDYIGLGPAAHSCVNSVRYAYNRDINAYIKAFTEKCTESDVFSEYTEISECEKAREKVMLGLRLSKGISESSLFSVSKSPATEKNIRSLIDCGYFRKTLNGYALTERGMYVSNSIINLFID